MTAVLEIGLWWMTSGGGARFALVLARVLGLCLAAPLVSMQGLGWRFRLLLAVGLAAVLTPMLTPELAEMAGSRSPALLGRACLAELAIGLALGLAAALIVAGARQAGEVVGAQAGLSPAALFDPEIDDGLTPVGHLYGLIALGTFLALDGPLGLLRGVVESYRLLPAGGLPLTAELAESAFERVGSALALVVRVAAPVGLALTLAGLAIGLLGRAAPSLQLVSLALPVRFALGLLLVLFGLAGTAATLTAAWTAAGLGL